MGVSGTTPDAAARITNDNVVTGSHSNAVSAYPLLLRYENKANDNKPHAEPEHEQIKSFLRPNVSIRVDVQKTPIIWTIAIAIDEVYGSICVTPTLLNIKAA